MHLIRGSLVSGTARCRTDCCESSTVCRAPGSAPLVINRWETLRGSRAKDRKQFHKAPVTPESLPLNKDIVTSQQVWNQMLVSSHESLKHLQPFKAQILGTSWCRCSLSWVLGADMCQNCQNCQNLTRLAPEVHLCEISSEEHCIISADL